MFFIHLNPFHLLLVSLCIQLVGNSGQLCVVLSGWLEDAALFAAIDNSLNKFAWNDWPEPLKNRHLVALEEVYQNHKDFVCAVGVTWISAEKKSLVFDISHGFRIFFMFCDADRYIRCSAVLISETVAKNS